MRLDATDLRYVSATEFRVLTAVEIGSKNHEVVPTPTISQISGIRSGIIIKALGELSKRKLIARVKNTKYDGYRLTYGGLDWLALRAFSRKKVPSVVAVGTKIGVGKESDIYLVKGEGGEERVLKLHRLGRISFRAIKEKRDYLGKRTSASWMQMSRLAAEKEFAFMKVLYEHDFPVPIPVDHSRHCIVMSLIDSYPLRQVDHVPSPSDLYATLMSLIVRLASHGLIHGDFNEFNILIKRKSGEPILIDFPQMVSTRHPNAEYFFDRDVNCIRKFFLKRFKFEGQTWPTWKDVLESEMGEEAHGQLETENEPVKDERRSKSGEDERDGENEAESSTKRSRPTRLDLLVAASGFGGALQRQLEDYMIQVQDEPEDDGHFDDSDYDEDADHGEDGETGVGDETEAHGPDEADKPSKPNNTNGEPDKISVQKHLADRIEAIRLHKALGNDDPADLDADRDQSKGATGESEEEASDLDSDDGSDAPSATDYDSFVSHPAGRVAATKGGKAGRAAEGGVAEQVKGERLRAERRGRGGKVGMGKMKGHKWKSSDKFIVGKDSGW